MFSFSQIGQKFAFGMSYGYRLNMGSFSVDYNFSGKAVITGEFSVDKYMGGGIGLGSYFYPLNEKSKFRPLIGISYTRTFGGKAGYGDDANSTIINVQDANYLTPWIGVRYNEFGKDPVNGKSLSLIFKVGYKIATPYFPKTDHVSGPQMPEKIDAINNYIENGFVGSIGLILNLPKRKKTLI
jgi:hypothetical protein